MPTITKQKLISMGQGGLVVTVPKAWSNFYGLKPGDVVIVVADGELRISLSTQENRSAKEQGTYKAKGNQLKG